MQRLLMVLVIVSLLLNGLTLWLVLQDDPAQVAAVPTVEPAALSPEVRQEIDSLQQLVNRLSADLRLLREERAVAPKATSSATDAEERTADYPPKSMKGRKFEYSVGPNG